MLNMAEWIKIESKSALLHWFKNVCQRCGVILNSKHLDSFFCGKFSSFGAPLAIVEASLSYYTLPLHAAILKLCSKLPLFRIIPPHPTIQWEKHVKMLSHENTYHPTRKTCYLTWQTCYTKRRTCNSMRQTCYPT